MSERMRKKSFLFTGLSILIIAVGIIGWTLRQNSMSQNNIFSTSIKSSVNFTLFYPTSLPEGFAINKQSIQTTQGQVITYTASDNTGHHIIFSIQQKPSTFDYDTFYAKSLSGTFRFSTTNGDAAVGKTPTGTLGSFVSGDSWVLVTSDEKNLSTAVFQTVIKSLQAVSS